VFTRVADTAGINAHTMSGEDANLAFRYVLTEKREV